MCLSWSKIRSSWLRGLVRLAVLWSQIINQWQNCRQRNFIRHFYLNDVTISQLPCNIYSMWESENMTECNRTSAAAESDDGYGCQGRDTSLRGLRQYVCAPYSGSRKKETNISRREQKGAILSKRYQDKNKRQKERREAVLVCMGRKTDTNLVLLSHLVVCNQQNSCTLSSSSSFSAFLSDVHCAHDVISASRWQQNHQNPLASW
jgi:hypothetical protein